MNLIDKLHSLPKDIELLLDKVRDCAEATGLKVYLVGGMVRDLIVGREDYDLDIVVEGDAHFFAQALAGGLGVDYKKHTSFGTATVYSSPVKIDLATARKETYAHDGALPEIEPSTLEDDLIRRDFTLNALALSLNADNFGELIDFYSGCKHLNQGKLCILHDKSFMDDPTRILRGIRFKERFGFRFGSQTSILLKEAMLFNALNKVSKHRIKEELISMFNEENVVAIIETLYRSTSFSFFASEDASKRPDSNLLNKVNKTLVWFDKNFPHEDDIDKSLIYFMVLFCGLNDEEVYEIVQNFAFNKTQRSKIMSALNCVVSSVARAEAASQIYKVLEPLSLEAIIFFYAKARDQEVKEKILHFYSKLKHISLEISGKDLKELGVEPAHIYSEILEETLHHKIDGKAPTKEHELERVKEIRTKIKTRKHRKER